MTKQEFVALLREKAAEIEADKASDLLWKHTDRMVMRYLNDEGRVLGAIALLTGSPDVNEAALVRLEADE